MVKSGEFKKVSMFIGEYSHSIDTKKRLALPSKFRSELGGEKIVVTRGLDKCLFAYPMHIWKGIAEKLGNFPMGDPETRSFVRVLLAGAVDIELDSQGRILIPEYLRVYAQMEKNIVIAGLYDRIELWNDMVWKQYKENAEKNTDEIAKKLGDLGLY